GNALWRQHKYDEAKAAFGKQIQLNPLDLYAHGNLGRLYVEQHQDSAAAVELTQAVSLRPKDPQLLVDLGKAHLALHQADSARQEFDRAIQLAPTASIWNNVAYVYAEAGIDLDLAERYVRMAVDATEAGLRTVTLDHLGPRDWGITQELAHFWDTLGWIYFQRGDLAKAEAYVRSSWLHGFGG